MDNHKIYITIIGIFASGFGLLVTTLLSIIIGELRHLRKDIKECVPDKHCKTMMSEHERRITVLETNK